MEVSILFACLSQIEIAVVWIFAVASSILIIITTNHYESTLCSCVYFVVKGEKRCLLITKMWEGSHPITSQTDEAWPLGLDLDPAELPDIYWRHTS